MQAQIAFRMRKDEKLQSVFGEYLNKSVEDYIRHAEQALKDVYSPIDQEYLQRLKLELRKQPTAPAE